MEYGNNRRWTDRSGGPSREKRRRMDRGQRSEPMPSHHGPHPQYPSPYPSPPGGGLFEMDRRLDYIDRRLDHMDRERYYLERERYYMDREQHYMARGPEYRRTRPDMFHDTRFQAPPPFWERDGQRDGGFRHKNRRHGQKPGPGAGGTQSRKMPLPERVRRLVDFLKAEDIGNRHPVSVLHGALNTCKLDLNKDFTCETFLSLGEKTIFYGKLYMSGLFLARAYGEDKKVIKNKCYETAVNLFLHKPLKEILNQEDPGTEEVKKELLEEYEEQKLLDSENARMEEDTEVGSFSSKLKLLKTSLKSLTRRDPPRKHVVEDLDKAVEECECELTYSDEEVKYKKMPWFIGQLKLQDTLIAAASGLNRESAKRSTYEQAVGFLKDKSLVTITRGIVVDKDGLMPESENITKRELPSPETEKNLQSFIDTIKDANRKKAEVASTFKAAAKDSGLTVLILTHRRFPVLILDLFLDNIHLATSEARNKHEAEEKLIEQAWSVCLSTSPDVMCKDFRRLLGEDSDDLLTSLELTSRINVMKNYTNNFRRVKEQLIRLQESEGTIQDEGVRQAFVQEDQADFVIFEESKWMSERYQSAQDILQLSAKMNLMLLQCVAVETSGTNRCRVFLQYDLMAECTGVTMKVARQRAFATLLFKLYQTQPTVNMGESTGGNSYESVTAKADEMREASGATEDELVEVTYVRPRKRKFNSGEDVNTQEETETRGDKQDERDGQAKEEVESEADKQDLESGTEKQEQEQKGGQTEEEEKMKTERRKPRVERDMVTSKLSKWVLTVVQDMLEEYSKKEVCDELVFGPGPDGYWEHIQNMGEKFNLRYMRKKVKDVYSLVIYRCHRAHKILEILEKNDGQSGQWALLPKTILPKPDDLRSAELAAKNNPNNQRNPRNQNKQKQRGRRPARWS